MRIAQRGQVPPFHVMDVIKAAARRQESHGDVVSLCVGQPSTPAPAVVRAAARDALDTQLLGYTEAVGILPLRQAIAEHYAAAYGVPVPPDRVVVTTGSSGGFTAVFLAAFEPGDVVAMARPGYAAYRNTLVALGCEVADLDCGEESRFQPTVALLEELTAERGAPPAGLIVASPANPTGTIIDASVFDEVARWCAEHGTVLISDEIYHGISYGRPCRSVLEFTPDSSVAVGSFSKYYSMTGWRLGWLVLPEALVRPVELLLGNLNLCPPALPQVAAAAAFSPEARSELDGHVARYAANRELLISGLPAIGLGHFAPPDGAFYLYADVSEFTSDSLPWCFEVLDATGVALTPGMDFDPPRVGGDPRLDGRTRVRISFAGSPAEMEEGMARLGAFLR